MLIERTVDEVIFKLPADVDIMCLQKIVDFLKYKEAIKHSKATQEQADELSLDIKKIGGLKIKNDL